MKLNKKINNLTILKLNSYDDAFEESTTVKKKKNFYVFKTVELFFMKATIKRFPFLLINTRAFQIENFVDLILKLNPTFLYELSNIKTQEEKESYVLKIVKPIIEQHNDPSLEERIEKRLKRDIKILDKVKKDEVKVNEFFESKLNEIENDLYYHKFFYWQNEINQVTNLVKNRYLTVKNKQVYSFDTTELPDKSFLTIFCDHGSGIIVNYFRGWQPPLSSEIISFIENYFTPILLERCKIIHSDRCGSNCSYEYNEFFKKKTIKLSHTSKKLNNKKIHGNQLIECTNNCLKHIMKNYKFKDDNTEFVNLTELDKEIFIKECIYLHNTTNTKKESQSLHGASRMLVNAGKEILYALSKKEGGEAIIIAKTKTKEGNYISEWHKVLVSNTELVLLQAKINETYNTNLDIIDVNHLLTLEKLGETINSNNLKEFNKITIKKKNELYSIINDEIKVKQTQFSKEELRKKIQNSMLERLNNAKSPEEKQIIQENLGLLLLRQEEDKELLNITKKALDESRALRYKLATTNKTIGDFFVKQNLQIERRNKRKTFKEKEKFSFYGEDLPVLLETLKKGKNDFVIAKYKIAHLFLAATGIRVSNLKFLNMEQIKNFINNKMVTLKLIKTKKHRFIYFPYAKGREKYSSPIIENVKYIKECIEINDKRLYQIDKNSGLDDIRLRSEIFGYASRSSLTAKMNEQLKIVGSLVKPRTKVLTTHSYRRGVANLCAMTRGILETKYLLGHESVTSTEAYLIQEPDIRQLKKSLKVIYNVNSPKKAKKIKMDEKTEHDMVDEIDNILTKERYQENDENRRPSKQRQAEEFDLPESDYEDEKN